MTLRDDRTMAASGGRRQRARRLAPSLPLVSLHPRPSQDGSDPKLPLGPFHAVGQHWGSHNTLEHNTLEHARCGLHPTAADAPMQGAAFVEFVIDHIASRSRGWQLHATIAELQRALSDLPASHAANVFRKRAGNLNALFGEHDVRPGERGLPREILFIKRPISEPTVVAKVSGTTLL